MVHQNKYKYLDTFVLSNLTTKWLPSQIIIQVLFVAYNLVTFILSYFHYKKGNLVWCAPSCLWGALLGHRAVQIWSHRWWGQWQKISGKGFKSYGCNLQDSTWSQTAWDSGLIFLNNKICPTKNGLWVSNKLMNSTCFEVLVTCRVLHVECKSKCIP